MFTRMRSWAVPGALLLAGCFDAPHYKGEAGPHFAAAGQQWGPFALALLPTGAYEPRSFMAPVHLNPAEAVQAHLDLRAESSIGIHYGTFQLTWEGIDEPLADLGKALGRTDIGSTSFDTLEIGETHVIQGD